jgi:type I restriction enzyme M protein
MEKKLTNREIKELENLFIALGFNRKEESIGIFSKKYPMADDYCLEIDTENQKINYVKPIGYENGKIRNFDPPENFVVLECVNRLLEKGYKPKKIILEKTYPAGHGTSGRLDICVTRDDDSEYLLIECKTYGKEFDKAFDRMKKNGGQLFTYFKFSNKPDIIMLYASELQGKEIIYRNEIVKIEDDYRSGDVKDFYKKWNKLTFNSGIWENPPYNFEIKKFAKKNLKVLNEEASKKLFHGFASILRKHSVSDKPNAFNKIFNLFLAKLYDEQRKPDDELHFHWREDDDPVDFQVRLIELYKEGLYEFLRKEIEGINDSDFKVETAEQLKRVKKKILKFNKIFDIKEVFDDETFEQNHRVLKEVVQLLEQYQIRYPRKQLHLSEFFERLLTTGLKQEAGQYFTPPPIAKFIVKSLPLQQKIETEINNVIPKLPATVDYAAGSGHFVTEILEEYQDIIDRLETNNFYPNAIKKVKTWSKDGDPYSWASTYVYGIEKDYRLVKVAKVGCYFYGDGVAQVIHGDGLDSFANSKSYIGLLKDNATAPQFSIVVSNPPYSVNDCKDDLEYIGSQHDFTLYPYLTDKSREIETLFVERAKQLLKDGGVAGVILPSSILSNTGIYTKAREIILQSFEIIAIAKFGSNTFMETGTNTVVLFLCRRNDAEVQRIREAAYQLAENYPKTHEDRTINGIEKPVEKYLNHTQQPEIDPEKLFYFILAYPQKNVVIINSGEKDEEKRFLGYEFSKRRGNEGMHSVNSQLTIDECTKLYDDKNQGNPKKASSYIYKAFTKEYLPIDEAMQNNVFYADLADMLTFDRDSFDKNISLAVKKKVKFDDIWKTDNLIALNKIAIIQKGISITKEGTVEGNIPVIAGGKEPAYFHNIANRNGNIITISASGAYSGFVNYFEMPIFASDCNTIQSKDEKNISTKLIYLFLKSIQEEIYNLQRGQAQPHVYADDLEKIQIPLPSLNIQQKIIAEIEALEKKETEAKERVTSLRKNIDNVLETNPTERYKLGDILTLEYGASLPESNRIKGEFPVIGSNGIVGYHNEYLVQSPAIIVGRKGSAGKITWINKNCFPIDTTFYVKLIDRQYNLKLIYYALQKADLENLSGGTGVPGLNRNDAYSKTITLPPLPEQQKIVAEIEKIETQITELEREIKEIPKQKEYILKKYM